MNDHSRIVSMGLAALASAAVVAGLAVPAAAGAPSRVMLRADTDRDGRLTAADDAGRGAWSGARGAIMLPNLDDDRSRCPKAAPDGARLTDAALAACDDASDDVVNGASDLADLARLEIPAMRDVSASAKATLLPDARSRDKVRVFVERKGTFVALGPSGSVRVDELRRGVRLAVEARDVIRDPAVWSGFTDLTLSVADRGATRTDRVRLRVAPVLFQNDLMPLNRVVVANPKAPETLEGRKTPSTPVAGEAEYRRDMRRALDADGLRKPFVESPAGGDQWMGDMYKTAYASMPGPGGSEHRIVVNLRSPAVTPNFPARDRPLRDASRPVFTKLRGPGVAGIQQFDATRVDRPDDNLYYGSASSTGNFGTIPPYAGHPTGRIVYGGEGEFTPDPTFTTMLAAQGYQDPVVVDTSWLGVGHIDEFMHFVPARNRRGWAMVVADPRMGMKILRDLAGSGGGSQRLIEGVDPSKTDKPGMTVAQALRDPALVDGTRIAGRGVDKALRQLREQAGITEKDIVRVPALFTKLTVPEGYPRDGLTVTYLPDAANGIATGTGTRGYLAPAQHGPRRNGKDLFEQATERALRKVGTHVRWIEDWDYAHHVGTAGGDIHCVTNVDRDLRGTTAWWRTPTS
ncbi:protein-arginine deiminase family protein [Actinomadura oligospora]|uniref:protein-arginine deiminase family protein n=1 Tax=Actinomadura oligospora TaxID=111804 RepID=UPI00147530B2|nr:protein-arginine deiminase family protein [Actinomadura oligospora]